MENDTIINKKVHAFFRNSLYPILLIGETKDERDKNMTGKVLEKQLSIGLKNIPGKFLEEMALVYEPVWAIGQESSASLDIIDDSHKMVRKIITKIYNTHISNYVRILYGGSVNIDNAKEIIKIPDVDGLAITRGALDAQNFINFIKITEIEAKYRFNKSYTRSMYENSDRM
ncbi:Triosephosphate isomerase [subsurface metagenome]